MSSFTIDIFVRASVRDLKEAYVIVEEDVLLLPVVHDHTLRAVRGTGAAAIPDEVRGTGFEPPAVRVVAVGAVVLDTAS
jgi:hypothetical protein